MTLHASCVISGYGYGGEDKGVNQATACRSIEQMGQEILGNMDQYPGLSLLEPVEGLTVAGIGTTKGKYSEIMEDDSRWIRGINI